MVQILNSNSKTEIKSEREEVLQYEEVYFMSETQIIDREEKERISMPIRSRYSDSSKTKK